MVLQCAVLVLLIFKRLWKTYPLFTSYTIVNSCALLGGYMLRERALQYFWFLCTMEGLTIFLGLGIAYEVFKNIFAPHRALKRLAAIVFAVCAVVLAFLGGFLILSKAPFGGTDTMKGVLVVGEAARILEVGVIGLLFLFSRAFGMHWRHSTFGIALGLGFIATAELVAITIQAEFGPAAINVLNLARTAVFDVSLLIWFGYILAPEPSLKVALPERSQLEEWNRAVMEFIQQ